MAKRIFDWIASTIGLLLISPLFILLALLIKLDSSGPVFFRQKRVGRFGKIFYIYKFRSMVIDADRTGPQITIGSDARVTRVGQWIRKYKFDELPQFINVWLGHMSLVGPRPEVPKYVDYYPAEIKEMILSVRPGITDRASIEFKNENEILGGKIDPERVYIDEIIPTKVRYYKDYVLYRSFFGDLKIIFDTISILFR